MASSDTGHIPEGRAVLSDVWDTSGDTALDADCSPTKTCRNMVGISFEGLADSGTDLATAWRTTLEREGKVADDATSLRDLVFGASND